MADSLSVVDGLVAPFGAGEGDAAPAGQAKCGDGAQERERGRRANGRGESVAERLGTAVAAGRGERYHQDRDAEGGAELPHHVERSGCLAGIAGRHRAKDHILNRRHCHGNPYPRDDQGRNQEAVGGIRRGDQRDPGHADRLEAEAEGDQRPFADPVDEAAGDRRGHEERRGPGQESQAGTERSVPLRGLKELGQEEEGAEQGRVEEEARGVAPGEGA